MHSLADLIIAIKSKSSFTIFYIFFKLIIYLNWLVGFLMKMIVLSILFLKRRRWFIIFDLTSMCEKMKFAIALSPQTMNGCLHKRYQIKLQLRSLQYFMWTREFIQNSNRRPIWFKTFLAYLKKEGKLFIWMHLFLASISRNSMFRKFNVYM